MAKRVSANNETPVTILEIDKAAFSEVLEKRISLGEEILGRAISTQSDLDTAKEDFSAWNDYNFEYLRQSFNHPNNEYKISYDTAGDYFSLGGDSVGPVESHKDYLKNKISNLKKLVAKVELLKCSVHASVGTVKAIPYRQIIKDSVFIVHGHDEEAKTKTARFIEKLGFKPIILHEQASSGKTIIEKIEEYSNVGFGVVLYTPCDTGGKKISDPALKDRARQNVVFEHGYLIGKIGRNNVCALVKGDIEVPNDISGVVYVQMDTADAWHLKVAKELRNSGYTVDMNRVI